jgi:hypothetical protein
MRIEEMIKFYDFLANCSAMGLLGIWFILTLFTSAAAFWGKDKLNLTTLTFRWMALIGIGLSVFAIIFIFNREAKERKAILQLANCVKSEYVMYGFKVVSMSDLINDFHCRNAKGKDIDTIDLKKLLEMHANEFVKVKTDDDDDGIRIIDPDALVAIDKYNREHLPFIKSRIQSYLKSSNDSVTYEQVRLNVDKYFDDEWIELMISKYDTVFVPCINTDTTITYSQAHGVKLKREAKAKKSPSRKAFSIAKL